MSQGMTGSPTSSFIGPTGPTGPGFNQNVLALEDVGSAITKVFIQNAQAGNYPIIGPTGPSNVDLGIQAGGTGVIRLLNTVKLNNYKNVTFSNVAPTNPSAGDIWIELDEVIIPWFWENNFSRWLSVQLYTFQAIPNSSGIITAATNVYGPPIEIFQTQYDLALIDFITLWWPGSGNGPDVNHHWDCTLYIVNQSNVIYGTSWENSTQGASAADDKWEIDKTAVNHYLDLSSFGTPLALFNFIWTVTGSPPNCISHSVLTYRLAHL